VVQVECAPSNLATSLRWREKSALIERVRVVHWSEADGHALIIEFTDMRQHLLLQLRKLRGELLVWPRLLRMRLVGLCAHGLSHLSSVTPHVAFCPQAVDYTQTE
jgi:hypothetical protein